MKIKNRQKGFIVPIVIVLVFLVIGGGIYYFSQIKGSSQPTNEIRTSETILIQNTSSTNVAKKSNGGVDQTQTPVATTASSTVKKLSTPTSTKTKTVSLTILFSRHIRSIDIPVELLKNEISKADIVLIEEPFWSSSFEDGFNAISRGEETSSQILSGWQITPEQQKGDDWQFLKFFMDSFYQSHAFITSVDLTQDEVLSQNIRSAVIALPQINGNNFKDILQNYKQKFISFANMTIQRENTMVDRYLKLVQNIQNGLISQVQRKDNVKILYVLGVNHTRVFDLLKERGLDVNKIFSYDPYVYNYSGDVTVKLLSQQPVSDDLFAHQLFESALETFIVRDWLDNDQKSARLERKIISQLSFEDIQNILDATFNSQDHASTFIQQITSITKQKNITIPLTKAEFEAYSI